MFVGSSLCRSIGSLCSITDSRHIVSLGCPSYTRGQNSMRDDGLFCLCPCPNTQYFIAASDTAMHATIISLKTVYHKHLLQTLNIMQQVAYAVKRYGSSVYVCGCLRSCTWRLQATSQWLTPSQKVLDSNPYVLCFYTLEMDTQTII